jgi:AMP nucleosidase
VENAAIRAQLHVSPREPSPLALFRAARIDYSLHRLYHNTGTDGERSQNFVIFANYHGNPKR